MQKIVECVPNFSEGKNEEIINKIVSSAKKMPGVIVLDVEKDSDHNRTVLSFIAPAGNAVDAMFNVVKTSKDLIDLNKHKGEHPRMGATDVAPFIPIMGSTIEDCIELAKKLAERIGKELEIPAYLYDQAAQKPERKNLAKIRKGQFEGLKEIMGKDPERTPDFGPDKIHPTFGAIAVGARHQIVNFNVNLDTGDIDFGKTVAKAIRESGGGLPCVRGAAIMLETKGIVQISTVLTDYQTTSILDVVNEIKKYTDPKGIKITGTELIGLTTQDAITDYAVKSLNVENFKPKEQILETQITKMISTWQSGANKLVEALASSDPTPGGGSAGAVSASMGAGLILMAGSISIKSKKVEESSKSKLKSVLPAVSKIKSELQFLISEDSVSYDMFTKAAKLPKGSPERMQAMQNALKYAAEVPLKTAKLSSDLLKLVKPLEKCFSPAVLSDVKCAGYLLEAGTKCAVENVYINTSGLKDIDTAQKLESEAKALV